MILQRQQRQILEQKQLLQERTIELEKRNLELDAFAYTVAHNLKNPLNAIMVLKDNGIGLDIESQSRLFTPFTRLHQRSVEGQGLGLVLVKQIVEKLGGQVGVESVTGQESLFYITFCVKNG